MKPFLVILAAIALAGNVTSGEEDEDGPIGLPTGDVAPRWFFLGEDDALRGTYHEAKQVVMICIFETTLENIRPPFAKVIHHATVTRSLKGDLRIGDKIEIEFSTDSLPRDDVERAKFTEKVNKKSKGSLRFAFLFDEVKGGEPKRFWTEFLYLPKYNQEMSEFLGGIAPEIPKGEQGGARQPATAPDSKSKGNEKPKPESEARSQ